jgi:2',3'-cyclic-nucleotide 2'-phosphodiesterase
MQDKIKILIVGDVVGQLGCAIFQKHVPKLKRELNIDAVIVNGENSAAQGRGITPGLVNFFKHNGANVITSGNHIWARKEILLYLDDHNDVLRPANFPSVCPGVGVTTFMVGGNTIAVINIQGRIFMHQHVDCPFKTVDSILTYLKNKTKIIIVDFHAEATSEKVGMGYYLDGKVSCVFGTHTHVQTADERILQHGTAFITDVGMCGALNSMIGMKKELILQSLISQMPVKFEVDINPPALLSGIIVQINADTGKAFSIERVRIIDESIFVQSGNLE